MVRSPEKNYYNFFDFKIDNSLSNRINEIHMFVSSDNEEDILESVEIIKKDISDIKEHKFAKHGHFTFGEMKLNKFPELLAAII